MKLEIQTLGQGKPLVLFHGWGFNHQIWMPWVTTLHQDPWWQNYQFMLIDLPGFGGTSFMEWNVFKSMLLERLPEKFAIMGWSLGGLMATRLSIEAPSRVTHLVNVASSPRFTSTTDWFGVEPHVFDDFYARFIENPKRTRQYFIRTQLQGQSLPVHILNTHATELGLEQGLHQLSHWDLRSQLSKLNMPVSYIFGRLDALVPYQLVPYMQQQYPNFRYDVFEKSAHVPFLSHPNAFNTCLKAFL